MVSMTFEGGRKENENQRNSEFLLNKSIETNVGYLFLDLILVHLDPGTS